MKKHLWTFKIVLMLTGFQFLCFVTDAQSKDNLTDNAKQRSNINVIINIDENHPGIKVPNNFAGFSYEVGTIIENPEYLNKNNKVLIRMIRNLGNGIIRIGGNSSDQINWTGQTRTTSVEKKSLTTIDIDRFFAFAKATGWKVLFGLNLGSNNTTAAANEARYVSNSLQKVLYAFQIGNEPDLYYKWLRPQKYDCADYLKEWEANYTKVKEGLPSASFAGPDVSHNIDWVRLFEKKEKGKIALIDGHYYRKAGNHAATTWKYILQPDSGLVGYLQTLDSASSVLNVPYRISECNSVSQGGKTGVSDVFSAALWTLDFMWTVAENNGQGINFHGGTTSHYAPIILKNGVPVPHPGYYAMLAFKYGSQNGNILPLKTTRSNNANCSAYSCIEGKNTYVTLINKDSVDIIFKIQLSKDASNFQVARLIAPSPTSIDSVNFANNTVNDDGAFTLGEIKKYPIQEKSLKVHVPAMSAAVVTIQ